MGYTTIATIYKTSIKTNSYNHTLKPVAHILTLVLQCHLRSVQGQFQISAVLRSINTSQEKHREPRKYIYPPVLQRPKEFRNEAYYSNASADEELPQAASVGHFEPAHTNSECGSTTADPIFERSTVHHG